MLKLIWLPDIREVSGDIMISYGPDICHYKGYRSHHHQQKGQIIHPMETHGGSRLFQILSLIPKMNQRPMGHNAHLSEQL